MSELPPALLTSTNTQRQGPRFSPRMLLVCDLPSVVVLFETAVESTLSHLGNPEHETSSFPRD